MQDPIITLPPPPLQTPTQPPLKCPRCESSNTKFCYYNNYNLAQPRHFCKDCRRYWTHGGSLRNIPPGGATRKPTTTAKRSIESANPNPNKRQAPDPKPAPAPVKVLYPDSEDGLLQIGGSFSSLLQSSGGQFGNLLDGFDSEPVAGVTFSDNPNPDPQLENLLGLGWPSGWAADLSIYTSPGDHFQ